jgi:predicted RNA binding protein YcfA (HicA-like mRNA interferase family)
MPAFGPISRRLLIRYLRQSGFEGPYSGGKHQFMVKGDRTLRIPNPHQTDVRVQLLTKILQQAGISRSEWERL